MQKVLRSLWQNALIEVRTADRCKVLVEKLFRLNVWPAAEAEPDCKVDPVPVKIGKCEIGHQGNLDLRMQRVEFRQSRNELVRRKGR